MVKSRRYENGGERFFAAVTRSCRTAVEISEKAVREQIAQEGVTTKNVAVFACRFNGINTSKQLTHELKFKFMARHHTALKGACLDFLEDRTGHWQKFIDMTKFNIVLFNNKLRLNERNWKWKKEVWFVL